MNEKRKPYCWFCGAGRLQVWPRCLRCTFTQPYRWRMKARHLYDFLFLRHEYARYPHGVDRCAPNDWADELEAICRGEKYVRRGHRLSNLAHNVVAYFYIKVVLNRRSNRGLRSA